MYLFETDHFGKENLIERASLVNLVTSVMTRNNLSNQGLCNLLELLNAMLVKECGEETTLDDQTYGGVHEVSGESAYEVSMVSERTYQAFLDAGGHDLLDEISLKDNLNQETQELLDNFG